MAALIVLGTGPKSAATELPVQVSTPTGVLHGTLEVPASGTTSAAVLLVAGSGPTDRDGNQPGLQNDCLKQLSHALAERGVAVLRHDKRGVGESARAAPAEVELRVETFVEDAVAWLARLRGERLAGPIAVVGHSEGALIGLLAAKTARVDGLVSIAGAGGRANELVSEQLRAVRPPALKRRAEEIVDALARGQLVPDTPPALAPLLRPSVQPYLISWFKYDPARELAGLAAAVLILHGTTDLQAPVSHARRLAAARPDARVVVVPDMNHVLKHATTPAEQERAYVDASTPIDARIADAIASFLIRR